MTFSFNESFCGSVPTLITPFGEDGRIDWPAVDMLVEYHIAAGCAGIFSPCLSSEMYELSPEERLELAERVYARAAGRCAVLATGTYGGSLEEMAETVKAMSTRCDAVVVVTCLLAAEADDDATWLGSARRLLELTPGVPLGTYECPVPYKRVLSPDVMRWMAGSGRFRFHKDTCCDLPQMQAKIGAVREAEAEAGTGGFAFFNANVETLLPSLLAGAAGFSGISANFYPHLHVFLCEQARRLGTDAAARPRSDLEAVQDFLSLAEATVCVHYPLSAKSYLRLVYASEAAADAPPMLLRPGCRKAALKGLALEPFQCEALLAMGRTQRKLSTSLGVVEIDPATAAPAQVQQGE